MYASPESVVRTTDAQLVVCSADQLCIGTEIKRMFELPVDSDRITAAESFDCIDGLGRKRASRKLHGEIYGFSEDSGKLELVIQICKRNAGSAAVSQKVLQKIS